MKIKLINGRLMLTPFLRSMLGSSIVSLQRSSTLSSARLPLSASAPDLSPCPRSPDDYNVFPNSDHLPPGRTCGCPRPAAPLAAPIHHLLIHVLDHLRNTSPVSTLFNCFKKFGIDLAKGSLKKQDEVFNAPTA